MLGFLIRHKAMHDQRMPYYQSNGKGYPGDPVTDGDHLYETIKNNTGIKRFLNEGSYVESLVHASGLTVLC